MNTRNEVVIMCCVIKKLECCCIWFIFIIPNPQAMRERDLGLKSRNHPQGVGMGQEEKGMENLPIAVDLCG